MRISVANSDRSFSAAPERPILEYALAAGLHVPYGCRGGNCGSCRARLLAGNVVYPNGTPLGLTPDEAADGFILLCRAHAATDLSLETVQIALPDEVLVKRLPARIERLQLLAHDVMGMWLRLPAVESFQFQAGQYLDILLPGGRRRSFSIASAPAVAPAPRTGPIELHVRRVEGGHFSEHVFTTLRVGDLLNVEGPLGRFAYAAGNLPLLLIGGGTGLAPLLSMLRYAAAIGSARPTALFWGVRAARDLYAQSTLVDLNECLPELRYVPVLSEPDAAWCGARGWVHAAALATHPDWAAMQVYAAGPPPLIEALRAEYARHGASTAQLAVDVFDYAVDAPLRQRSSDATNS